MRLKGLGDARAAAIVKGRPGLRKDDLGKRGIVPASL
jgi:DNA uptake protein ComE-like DNA-binding protein